MKFSQIKNPSHIEEGVSMAPSRLAVVLDDESIRCGFEAEWFDKGLILEVPTDVEDLKQHPDFIPEHFESLIDDFKNDNWDWETMYSPDQIEDEVWRESKEEILKAMGLDLSVPMSAGFMNDLVADFEEKTGIKIKEHCIGYNCADKTVYDGYFLETDGFGPELVSPVQTVQKTLNDLKKIFKWLAERPEAITTKEKGLHFGVSIKGVGPEDIDFLKLAMFLGEKYVLDQFGRYDNDMTAPHMPKVYQRLRSMAMNKIKKTGSTDTQFWMQDAEIREELIGLLNKIFAGEKFRSFNVLTLNKPDPYIEFRIPGNAGYEGRYEEIKHLLLRVAFCMKLAADPTFEHNEYMKKLYKLVDQVNTTVNKDVDDAKMDLLRKGLAGQL